MIDRSKLISDLVQELVRAPLNRFTKVYDKRNVAVVVCKFNEFIDTSTQGIALREQVLTYPLFDIQYLDSLSILSAYIFFINGFNLDMNDYYFKVIRPSSKDISRFSETKLMMQDKYINIFHSNDGASLVSFTKLRNVITPSMVRKSERNERESEEYDALSFSAGKE